MEKFILPCEKQYDNKFYDYIAIHRFVWYQIRKMINDDKQLGRILKVEHDGFLRVNMNTKLLTSEQKDYVARLINNERNGIYRIHRFKDLRERIDDKDEYNKWFDEKAMNSFMQTIPTKQVFYTYPEALYKNLKQNHSSKELNREDFCGYSIWQTLYALDIIDPFLVALMIGNNVNVTYRCGKAFIEFSYNDKQLCVKYESLSFFVKDGEGNNVFVKNDEGKYVDTGETIHTLLFRHFQEPIYTTINSLMLPIGGYRVMPTEGLGNDPMRDDIITLTTETLKSETYKGYVRSYGLGHSRVE